MSIVFMEGFDLYNGVGSNVGIGTRWIGISGGFSFSTQMTTGRFGGQALRFISAPAYNQYRAVLPAAYSAVSMGFALRLQSLGQAVTMMWLALDGSVQICLRITALGQLQVLTGDGSSFAGATSLGVSAAAPIIQGTWHYIEVSTLIADAGGIVTVKVDGVTVLALTGQDTKALAGAGVNQVWVGAASSWTGIIDFDDIYLADSATGIGERRIETLRPAADTAQKDWSASAGTSNWAQVDDGTCDGESSYVQAGLAGERDLYELANLSTTPAVIDAVQPVMFARKSDAATRSAQVSLQSGGVDDDGAAYPLSADYNAVRRLLTADPQDGTAWTKSRVDAVKLGPKVAA